MLLLGSELAPSSRVCQALQWLTGYLGLSSWFILAPPTHGSILTPSVTLMGQTEGRCRVYTNT